MLYGLVIVIHVIAALVLILMILLQAGRGGGLSETFGMSSSQTIFGQSAPKFMEKATSICAIVFILTSLSLAVLSVQKSRSVVVGTEPMIPQVPLSTEDMPDVSGAEESRGQAVPAQSQ
jgi:preprotein translocase subunit SecG